MSPLKRKVPNRDIKQNNRSRITSLGTYKLDSEALGELIQQLKALRVAPHLYVGGWHAPKGMDDIDDATWGELQDIKIICEHRPKMTIYLGYRGAYIIGDPAKPKNKKIIATVVRLLEPYYYPRVPPIALLRPVLWLLFWTALITLPIVLQIGWILALSLGALPVVGVVVYVSLVRALQQVRRRGGAIVSLRPIRQPFLIRWPRNLRWHMVLIHVAWSTWLVVAAIVQRVIISIVS